MNKVRVSSSLPTKPRLPFSPSPFLHTAVPQAALERAMTA